MSEVHNPIDVIHEELLGQLAGYCARPQRS